MKVKEVMSKDVQSIGPKAHLDEAARIMKEHDIGILPVLDGEEMLGTITDRDITIRGIAAGRNPKETPVKEAMTPGSICCEEDASLIDAAQIMKDKQLHRLPVLDGKGKVTGVLSLGDLARRSDEARVTGETLAAVKGS